MPILFEIIQEYILSNFKTKGNLFYLGTITNADLNSDEKEVEFELKIGKGPNILRHNGYFYYDKQSKRKHTVTYAAAQELFTFAITKKQVDITIKSYQVTKVEHELPQAITKEDWDWDSIKTIKLSVKGDYNIQMSSIEEVYQKILKTDKKFRTSDQVELWLDHFI